MRRGEVEAGVRQAEAGVRRAETGVTRADAGVRGASLEATGLERLGLPGSGGTGTRAGLSASREMVVY